MNWFPDDVQSLLNAHGAKLFALLVRLTLRVDVAEDLLQELFCKMVQSEGFRKADNRLAFAYRAATNLALDWRRAKKRSPLSETASDSLAGANTCPLSDLVQREELERTLSAISELPTSGAKLSCCGTWNTKVTTLSPASSARHNIRFAHFVTKHWSNCVAD